MVSSTSLPGSTPKLKRSENLDKGARRAPSMDWMVSSSRWAGGVRARVRVGASGSWVSDKRGGCNSSDEGDDNRDRNSGGGGDNDDDSERARTGFVVAVVRSSLPNARISIIMKNGSGTS
jgi:hypothetical protein